MKYFILIFKLASNEKNSASCEIVFVKHVKVGGSAYVAGKYDFEFLNKEIISGLFIIILKPKLGFYFKIYYFLIII